MKIYFGPGFSMSCAGQEIKADEAGFAEVDWPTPEIMAWAKPEPVPTAPITTEEEHDA
jgi:hypothetical protein